MTNAELERLGLLSEELGEAVQIIGKILRHGKESVNPDGNNSKTNMDRLHEEIGDVLMAIQLMVKAGDLEQHTLDNRVNFKSIAVHRWLHHQPDPTLRDVLKFQMRPGVEKVFYTDGYQTFSCPVDEVDALCDQFVFDHFAPNSSLIPSVRSR